MKDIIIHEVGMRDGLQMESASVPTETKLEWIRNLVSSGLDIIQLGSFVNPQKVPQMQDTDELFRILKSELPKTKTKFSGLVLNEKGFERGLQCGADMFCFGVSASDTHSRKNTGMSTEDATQRIIAVAREGIKAGLFLQASVQSAFGCGFEGAIDENKVYTIIQKYLDAGITNISLADTAGHAHPSKVERMFNHLRKLSDKTEFACHFHNTYGMGMANCYKAMECGVKYIETAFGGLGGCPFTKMASGNVATEDFINMMNLMDKKKDIELDRIIEVSKSASEFFGKELPGYVYKTGIIRN